MRGDGGEVDVALVYVQRELACHLSNVRVKENLSATTDLFDNNSKGEGRERRGLYLPNLCEGLHHSDLVIHPHYRY